MEPVPATISFPKTEEDTLKFWDEIDAFRTSLEQNKDKPEFTFYDGPPFATGLPHYGHLLTGTIKDTVTRYAHQTGHHVSRRFGWDCHGLPIEFEIDKMLGVKTRDDVLAMGIDKYNETCRSIVMRYSKEWEKTVKRTGRWIDFENDYKTMDLSFMETIWWVFSQLYEKGLVYKDYKIMPYSTACSTPLSNFEANSNYKDVCDPAVIVTFPLVDEPEVKLLAWTTTPWTLPSNLALCVNPELNYVKIRDIPTGNIYVLCDQRLDTLYPTKKKKKAKNQEPQYEVLEKFSGKELEGKKYTPLFDYFVNDYENGFRVNADSYVTDSSGTGIVHQAPAFGEDDFRVCAANNVITKGCELPCPVDADGRFVAPVTDFAGVYVKDADKDIKARLKKEGRLVHEGTIVHSYPFCWRSDKPLIYRAVPSWFVAVEKVKDRLVENNQKTYWVPAFVKEKRFHNWLVDARDWCVSRNRFWGTPLPIWENDQGERICIGSVEELEKLSGEKVTDLHRHKIDHIEIPSKKGGPPLKRISEVFDCWFESGSMPYAQSHYPFENKDRWEKGFPADFIAEGLDQTRGWFYTLMVLSTALFDKPAFKNLIVNGLVLAEDGKKMSKRLKNYPDPVTILDSYGADVLRLYLINSPVVRAEPLRFIEQGVKDVIKDVFLPWFNAYRFLVQSCRALSKTDEFVPDVKVALASENLMDKWILACCHHLVKFVREEMEAYRLYTVVPKLVAFIEQLTNWYVRFNRSRLKGNAGTTLEDQKASVNTLYEVLITVTRAMAPFTPFFTEYLYQNLRNALPEAERKQSVHFESFPTFKADALNERVEEMVSKMQTVIELGRAARDRRNKPLKLQLTKALVMSDSPQVLEDLKTLSSYITQELNVRELVLTSDEAAPVRWVVKPDCKALGRKLKKAMKPVLGEIGKLSQEQIKEFQKSGSIEILGNTITSEEVQMSRVFDGNTELNEATFSAEMLVVLDLTVDESMVDESLARAVCNRVQKAKKKAGVDVEQKVKVYYELKAGTTLERIVSTHLEKITSNLKSTFEAIGNMAADSVKLADENTEVEGEVLRIVVVSA